MGIAAFLHGAGFTGSGERYLSSVVGVEGRRRWPRARAGFQHGVRAGNQHRSLPDRGRGAWTAVRGRRNRAAGHDGSAEQRPDGRLAHGDGRGKAGGVRRAQDLKQTLTAAGMLGDNLHARKNFAPHAASTSPRTARFRSLARYEPPANIYWDDQKYRGEAYAAFAWAVYVAEVTVDLATYSVSVDDFVALQEVGRVLNPVLARGQIIGGVAQGIGFALYEKVEWRDGRMQNGQMTNYIMPTSADVPPIRVFFEELGNTAWRVRREGNRRAADGWSRARDRECDRRCARDSVRFDSACFPKIFSRRWLPHRRESDARSPAGVR